MLTLALVLLAQTPGLPADTTEATRICSAIELRSMAGQPNLAGFSRALHFNLLAARETRGQGRMMDNLAAEQALILPRVTGETDDLALRDDCRRRFPQAWATSATLPEDAFDRGTLCVAATATTMSLSRSLGEADADLWQALNRRLIALPLLTNDQSRRRGINSSEAMKDYGDGLMQKAIDTSGLLVIAEACKRAYPG